MEKERSTEDLMTDFDAVCAELLRHAKRCDQAFALAKECIENSCTRDLATRGFLTVALTTPCENQGIEAVDQFCHAVGRKEQFDSRVEALKDYMDAVYCVKNSRGNSSVLARLKWKSLWNIGNIVESRNMKLLEWQHNNFSKLEVLGLYIEACQLALLNRPQSSLDEDTVKNPFFGKVNVEKVLDAYLDYVLETGKLDRERAGKALDGLGDYNYKDLLTPEIKSRIKEVGETLQSSIRPVEAVKKHPLRAYWQEHMTKT